MKDLPSCPDAETALLGALITEPMAWEDVEDKLSAEDFFCSANRTVFRICQSLIKENRGCDLVTVTEALRGQGQLDGVGGHEYMARLCDRALYAPKVESYAKMISEQSLLRKTLEVCHKSAASIYEREIENPNEFVSEMAKTISSLADNNTDASLVHSNQLIGDWLKDIERLANHDGSITGLPTGLSQLDHYLTGLQRGDLVVVAARPSVGKTALGLNIAAHAALDLKKKVCFFSLEMTKEQILTRIIGLAGRIQLSHMKTGNIPNEGWARIIEVASLVNDSNLYIDDTSGISPYEVRAKCRRLNRQDVESPIDLIVVDYLQIMRLSKKTESREREVAEMSSVLKALAKELRVPVIALAQLNRNMYNNSRGEGRLPVISDIRESGAIEADADVILLLHRQDYQNQDSDPITAAGTPANQAEIIIGKQRNGPVGTVSVGFNKEIGRFFDIGN